MGSYEFFIDIILPTALWAWKRNLPVTEMHTRDIFPGGKDGRLFGPTYENRSWRIKTNEELDKLIKHENIINFARAQRLGWYGHIERMQDTRMVKAILAWKSISKRPMFVLFVFCGAAAQRGPWPPHF